MKKKSYWLSISVFVLILIWTVYYYAMQYTGGFADLKDSIVCGIAGLICIVFIVKRTIDFLKTKNRKISVCRTDKTPLGTKGRTSILSVESSASCGASFSVSRRKLHDRECCVTSFRQGGYTPLRR